ncbi:rhomboid family intramembrane serine protease [Sphingomicrobium marinum]|uniref:rhomboid family intramembrane serine protease n=1 Tax=Sphingomicrobium marinum TaxID=1227950 RepID=UPI00223FAA25|nr:rhomboid family intramembrane serine protease [Sphingomicrobium marinum]
MEKTVTRTATFAIGAVTVLTSIMVIVLGWLPQAAVSGGVIPARFEGLEQLDALLPSTTLPAFLTPLSATLLHADFLHLGFNMLLLFWCGIGVERVLGKGPVVFLYVLGAYTAATAQVLVQSDTFLPMIGASGAVSALIGAFAVGFGKPREISKKDTLNRFLNGLWLFVVWVGIQWGFGFASSGAGQNIAVAAHIGGFVAGLLAWRPLLIWRYRRA